MKDIFMVLDVVDYEGEEIIDIFETKEEAVKCLDYNRARGNESGELEINKMVVKAKFEAEKVEPERFDVQARIERNDNNLDVLRIAIEGIEKDYLLRIDELEKELPKHQIFKVKHQNSCQTCKHNEKGVDEKPCVDCVRDDELSYYESMQIINETIEHHKKDVDNFHPESFDSYGKEWRIMSVDGDVLARKTLTGIAFRFPDGPEKIFTYKGLFNGILIGRCKDCESFDPFKVGASCQNSRGGKNPGPTFGCIEWKAKP